MQQVCLGTEVNLEQVYVCYCTSPIYNVFRHWHPYSEKMISKSYLDDTAWLILLHRKKNASNSNSSRKIL